MPCPYFVPTERLQSSSWARAPRMPLGEPCRGVCHAGGEPFEPVGEQLESACNRGYARAACSRYPAEAEVDAMRYSIAADSEREIEIHFILEKDYAPLRHGRAIYNRASGELSELSGVAAAQARAFIEIYSRRKRCGS